MAPQDRWIPLSLDCASEHAQAPARIRDGKGFRFGRIRTDGKTLALDNGSVINTDSTLELLDLEHMSPYERFKYSKIVAEAARLEGNQLGTSRIHESQKPHQRDAVRWGYRGQRRAFFLSFGMGKTRIQLDILRLLSEDLAIGNVPAKVLQVAPKGVHLEFINEAEAIGVPIHRIFCTADARPGINLCNYEPVRDHKIDPRIFGASSADEAAVFRSKGATETFREFMTLFEGLKYKFIATATPSPNNLDEIAAYAAYLEIATVSQVRTRFFVRNSTKVNDLTLNPAKLEDFFTWMSTWALFLESPGDLGHDPSEYILPGLTVNWHCIDDPAGLSIYNREGQRVIGGASEIDLPMAARIKRESIGVRLEKAREIISSDPDARFIIWHHRDKERDAIKKLYPHAGILTGSMPDEDQFAVLRRFKAGEIRILAAKPEMYGAGANFQQVCHRAIFLGLDYKAYYTIQAVHRIHRFMQKEDCVIDMIYVRSEAGIKQILDRKWREDVKLRTKMTEIVREHGLVVRSMSETVMRRRAVRRQECSGKSWKSINNDAVLECERMKTSSVHMGMTSWPFGPMFVYTESVSDFSFADDYGAFFAGMDFLTPHLLRTLMPGRIMCVHVKDRVTPGNLSGLGYATLIPFSDMVRQHCQKHGFGFVARITIATDVVSENKASNRLGYTNKRKDGTSIGHGLPEYILVFRKRQTSRENGRADEPVTHDPPMCLFEGREVSFNRNLPQIPGSGYSVGRWQIDASGHWRSSGNRLADFDELMHLSKSQIFQLWREESESNIYNHARHVQLAEILKFHDRLPSKFSLIPAHALKDDPYLWTRIARMRTLNMIQKQKGMSQHLCPMQWDTLDRCIDLFSNIGEIVFDPCAGIGSTMLRAVEMGRYGLGCELCPKYYDDGLYHLQAHDEKHQQSSIFDLLGITNTEDR